jgi:hypothetical protein
LRIGFRATRVWRAEHLARECCACRQFVNKTLAQGQ